MCKRTGGAILFLAAWVCVGGTWWSALVVADEEPPAKDGRAEGRADAAERAHELNAAGVRAFRKRQYAQAKALFEQALETRRQLHEGDHPAVAQSLNDLATCLGALGRPNEALPHYQQALEMNKRLFEGDHPAVASSLNSLAYCLEALGRPRASEALPLLEQALEMNKRLFEGDHPAVASSLHNLAYCLNSLGRPGEALPLYQQAHEMRRRLHKGDHPAVANCLNNLAKCLYDLSRPGEALPLLEQALEMNKRLKGDHPNVAMSLNSLAYCLGALGRPSEALPLYQQAHEMNKRLFDGDHPDVASSLHSLALGLQDLGRPGEALPLYQQAFEMRKRLYEGDHPDVATSLNSLALCLQDLGRPGDALPLLKQALEVDRRRYEGDHPDVATSLNNLASCLNSLGRPGEALPLYQQALEMRKRLYEGDHTAVANSLNNLAWLLYESFPEQRADVILLLEQAVEQLEALRSTATGLEASDRASFFRELRRGSSYRLMVRALLSTNQVSRAASYLERSRGRQMLDLLHQGRVDALELLLERAVREDKQETAAEIRAVQQEVERLHKAVSEATHRLALVRQRGDLAEAARATLLQQARTALREAQTAYSVARRRRAQILRDGITLASPSTSLQLQGALGKDERLLQYAFDGQGGHAILLGRPGTKPTAFSLSWPEAAENDSEAKPPSGALTADSLAEEVTHFLSAHQVEGVRGRLRVRRSRQARDLRSAARRGARLLEALLPSSLRDELAGTATLYVMRDGAMNLLPLEALVLAHDDKGATKYLIEDEGFPRISYVSSGSALIWSKQQRDRQQRSEARFEVVALGDPIYGGERPENLVWPASGAFVIQAGEWQGATAQAGARAPLFAGDVILSYDGQPTVDYKALRREQRRVTDELEDGEREVTLAVWREGKRLALSVPSGTLGIEIAKRTPRDAAESLKRNEAQKSVYRSNALQAHGRLGRLIGTAKEVRAIKAAYEGEDSAGRKRIVTYRLRAQARERTLYDLAPKARILHLATHGLVDERRQASYSALALTLPPFSTEDDDGFLTLVELFEKWGDRLSGCELAVLSACDTQRGPLQKDEGITSLVWGFHYAGCPSIIASLWKVADMSTAKLMSRFYKLLAEHPEMTKLEAFTKARREHRKEFPDPKHWAPFIYIGDPR